MQVPQFIVGKFGKDINICSNLANMIKSVKLYYDGITIGVHMHYGTCPSAVLLRTMAIVCRSSVFVGSCIQPSSFSNATFDLRRLH